MNITTQTVSKNSEGQDELFVAGNYINLATNLTEHFAKWLTPEEYASYCEDPSRLGAIVESYLAHSPPPAKNSVSMRQARLALLQSGLLTSINTALETLPGEEGEKARIEWEYATEVDRDWPLVNTLAEHMSITQEQLNDLFDLARTL